jgi:hypothetical protein
MFHVFKAYVLRHAAINEAELYFAAIIKKHALKK